MRLPLACPAHHDPLENEAKEWVSPRDLRYPIVDGSIPWLFPDPKFVLAEWRERANMLLQHLELEVQNLKLAVKSSGSELTRKRLERTRELRIRHLEMLRRTLDPLKPQTKLALPKSQAFGYKLPLRQQLLGYFPNLIRDWSPRFASENAALLKLTLEMVEKSKNPIPQTVLVLGAGGSRLAYDLAGKFPESTVIAFDLNPLLLLAAHQINDGRVFQGVETSFSAKDPANIGAEVELKSPQGPRTNLHFVFGDVYALPFLEASVDLCVTPWLLDIVPRRFADLCAAIARVVKPEGAWVNTGSLHFDFRDDSENYSLPELEEIAAGIGWKPTAHSQSEMPYLQSEFDAHRRFETVTQFLWTRTSDAVKTVPVIDDRADWIRSPSTPVPAFPVFASSATTHGVMALVLSLVDGKRTLQDIAKVVSEENGLSEAEALDAASHFFDRYLRDRRFREST